MTGRPLTTGPVVADEDRRPCQALYDLETGTQVAELTAAPDPPAVVGRCVLCGDALPVGASLEDAVYAVTEHLADRHPGDPDRIAP